MSKTGADVIASDGTLGGDDDLFAVSPSVTQAEIDDIMGDASLPLGQRRAMLEALLGRVGEEEPLDRGDEYVPLDMRITDALAMLADGGHDYAVADAAGLDPETRSDARSPDDIDDETL